LGGEPSGGSPNLLEGGDQGPTMGGHYYEKTNKREQWKKNPSQKQPEPKKGQKKKVRSRRCSDIPQNLRRGGEYAHEGPQQVDEEDPFVNNRGRNEKDKEGERGERRDVVRPSQGGVK